MDIKKTVKNILKRSLYLLYLSMITLILLEIIYRYQLIDFYKYPFTYLNPNIDAKKTNTLIFGDSFSVTPDSYIKILRDSLPNQNFINCALSGTGIIQTNITAPQRIKKYPPSQIIYQIYVGNDLHDIRKNTFNGHLPVVKSTFYFLTNYFRSLSYVNYELGQFAYYKRLKSQTGIQRPALDSEKTDIFSVEKYSPYERQLLTGDPQLLENTILQKGDRKKDMERLLAGIDVLIQDSIPLYLLIIPHCSQVNEYYRKKYQELGVSLPTDKFFYQIDYPFIKSLSTYFTDQTQVKIINLLPYLQQADTIGKRMFYENDFHLTTLGQITCAKALKEQF